MDLPFSTEQFLGVFTEYNRAIWPVQIVAYVLGGAAVALAMRQTRYSDRIIVAILALGWLWTGVVYHGLFFRQINPAAIGFATLFVIQAGLLIYAGVVRHELRFAAAPTAIGLVGGLFVLYAMLLYPLLGATLGHSYPHAPVFGLTPCPLTIFTMGVLLWTSAHVPRPILVIPLLWSLLGVSAAISLGIQEDLGLLIAGLIGTALVVWRDCHTTPARLHQATAA
jgi:hypothetical protein